MSRHILWITVLTVTLLVGWGCQEESANITPLPPPAEKAESQPAMAVTTAEPNLAVAAQEQVKTEQPTVQEPNIQKLTPPEPNIQPPPSTEPNEQKETAVKPAAPQPAESNSVQPQTAPAAQTQEHQLCGICTDFLNKYVNQQGMVDYRSLLRKKLELVELLNKFKTFDRKEYNSWSKDSKLAFWINAYNLEFTKIILDNYPIESTRVLRLFWPPNSIRHIKGIWDEHKFIIMDEEFTLREIETRFFINEFAEPRVFLAIAYGSVSGAPLRNEAYCGENLSAQLDDQVKKSIAGSQAFKIDRENQRVYLSSIFNPTWYGQRFVANFGTDLKFKQQVPEVRAVLNFLMKYISPQDVSFLETGNYTVEFIRYDWTLNERAGQ